MKILLLLLFSLYYSSIYIYNPEYILYIFNQYSFDANKLQFFITTLSKTFEDAYAFKEISKNPPNPTFSPNYFNKVDIQKKLNEINTEKGKTYSFYQDLKKALFSLEDLHINFDLSRFLDSFTKTYFTHPLNLYIKLDDNNIPRFYGAPTNINYIWPYLKNNVTVYETIQNNLNVPISTINGKNPFDYITDFGKDYLRLKNRQSTFIYKYSYDNIYDFYKFPVSIEDLTNFTVVYDNNETFSTDYVILSTIDFKYSKLQNEESKENEDKKKDSYNILLDKNKLNKEKAINFDNNQINDETIRWDYNYSSFYKCRVDHEKKINVNFISYFGSENIKDYLFETIINCVELFDKNKYPVILIISNNPGGQVFIAQVLLELLSPKISFNIYMAFRKTNSLKKTDALKNYLSIFYNSKNCEGLTYEDLTEKNNLINYGNNISDILTQPFVLLGKNEKEKINEIKKNLTNPRKPTDILIYTDGYSYSAAAIFLKYLQYYGGGITVGFFSHPNVSKTDFDSGISPSLIFDSYRLQILSPEGYKPFSEQYTNIMLQIPGIQTFYDPNNLSVPLEYEVTPVDEVANIYAQLDDSKQNYDIYVNKALEILDKYKNECNPNNKKLVFVTSECDKTFKNKYTHGGYLCGDDGKWSKNCVASYCDIGYIFDHKSKKCIIDICSNIPKEDKNNGNNKDNKKLYYALFSIFGILLIVLILFIIFIICRKKRIKNSEVESIENINLVERDS